MSGTSVLGYAALLGLLLGSVVYIRATRRVTLDQHLDALVAASDANIGPQVRARLLRHSIRRSTFGGGWGVVGYLAGLFVFASWLRNPFAPDAYLLSGIPLFIAAFLGYAASAIRPQGPHSRRAQGTGSRSEARGYHLHRSVVAVEAALVVVGLTAGAYGATAVESGNDAYGAWLTTVVGALVAVAAACALVVQRLLLAAPMAAGSEAEATANAIVLARALRDSAAAVSITVFYAGCFLVFTLDLPGWQFGLGLAAVWALSARWISVHLGPSAQ